MRTVPVAPAPNQSLSVVLNDLEVGITLRTLDETIYADIVCEGIPICAGRICQDRIELTARAAQLGFPELILWFADLRGVSDPRWEELGTRYLLLSSELLPDPDATPFA